MWLHRSSRALALARTARAARTALSGRSRTQLFAPFRDTAAARAGLCSGPREVTEAVRGGNKAEVVETIAPPMTAPASPQAAASVSAAAVSTPVQASAPPAVPAAPPRPPLPFIAASGALSFAGIGALSLVDAFDASSCTMMLGSFGATAVLVFGAPVAPFSQPRNVVLGHMISAACGVGAITLCSPILAAPLAVASATALMQVTRSVHPPAGGTALIAVLGPAALHDLGFALILPAGIGGALLVLTGLVNNLVPGRKYPQYWW